MSAAEEKIDPYDGKARTLAELTRMTQGAWGEEQVLKYWETQCKPVPVDPYMSHLQAGKSSSISASRNLGPAPAAYPPASEQQSPTRPASQVVLDNPDVPPGPFNLGQDPFMTQGAARGGAEGAQAARDDVDAQGVAQAAAARELLEQAPPQQLPQKHWKESMFAALGPGDQDRQPKARSILLTVPILMFMWEIIVFTLLQHISSNACWLMTSILVVISGAAIAMWTLGIRWGPVSLLALGGLCLLAVSMGAYLGGQGWELYWRGFWWVNIGQQNMPTTASTPAGARNDAATLSFRDAVGTTNHTSVDVARSAGFKATDLYCVAPILSPETAGSEFPRVNYWAVGINCCAKLGFFNCDASRQTTGGYGVVQLGGGMPCPSCNTDHFRLAIAKAEAEYGLVSAPGALLVRWVSSTSNAKLESALWAIGFSVIALILGSFFLYFVGWLAWYYGLGKWSHVGGIGFGFQDSAARQKRLQ
eukprot:TRINITY_DN14228_c0_g1_i1.p1 TRINITY_DN14228_c0_g1~~TRINITY_DN14228_c0_g1_i1.p1  ORF type:complete len:476 (+),score=81.83 TRINITY_DN14228_c0_g1_i1:143-1570(+)